MKKFITAAALAAFALATTTAMAQDTKNTRPNLKTPTEQQMDTQSNGGAKTMNKMNTPATTGAGTNAMKPASKADVPGKPSDSTKNVSGGGGAGGGGSN